jgi:hypothetical protein
VKQTLVLLCNCRSGGCQISRGAQHGGEVSGAEYGSGGGAPRELQLANDASAMAQRRNGRRPSTRTLLWLLPTSGTGLNQAGCYCAECHHLHCTTRKCQIQTNINVIQPLKHKLFVLMSVKHNQNISQTCFRTLPGHH